MLRATLILAVLLPTTASAFDLVYTGGLRGLTPARVRVELHERLQAALPSAGVAVDSVEVLHGLMSQGDWEVWPEDGRIASAVAYAGAPATCDEGVVVSTLRTPTERFVATPGAPELPLADAETEPRRWQRCEAGGVSAIALGPVEGDATTLALEAWSLRTAFRWEGGGHSWLQLSRPRREPGRVVGVIEQALAGGARFAGAGDLVEPGHGAGDAAWAERRTATFDVLRRLDPVALAVGAAELAGGLEALLKEGEGLPWVATNWSWGEAEASIPGARVVDLDGQQVAFLGVTDPAAADPRLGEVQVLDPVDAVHAMVDELNGSGEPPDRIVLLAHVSPTVQAALRSRLRGVDLLLGDQTAATFRVRRQRTELTEIGDAFKAAPITLPLDGVALARIEETFVEVEPLVIAADAPVDPTLTARATALRAAAAAGQDVPLIPAEAPLDGVADARWQKLVCEALLDATGADVAFLGGLPRVLPTPGPLTALQVHDRLAGGHVVEVHKADGDRFVSFLNAAHGVAPITCGAPTRTPFPRAQGRPLDPLRTYRIATTDITRETTELATLLPTVVSPLVGHRPTFRPLRDADGPVALDRLVLEDMQEAPDGWVESWEARKATDVLPQAILDVRRISLRAQRFEGPHTEAYATVPEGGLSSPSSFTIGADADVALEASNKAVRTTAGFSGSYASFFVDGLEPQETADTWRVYGSIALPGAALPPRTGFRFQPFAELSFDSEFTPQEGTDGPLPQRADLSVYAGVETPRVGALRRLRLGPFVNRDLGQLETKLTEFGGRFQGATFHSPLPLSALWVTTAWDVQLFAPTEADDASDLLLRAWGEVRGSVRLVRSLSLGVYLQGLLVAGRVQETQAPTGTVTFGVALDVAAAVRLGAPPLRR